MSVRETLKAIAKWKIDAIKDPNPESLYVSEDQIDAFIDAPPSFVIGKKGTGKTAFATKLAARFPDNIHHVSFHEVYATYLDIQRHQKYDDAPTREVALQLAACLSALRCWAKNTGRSMTLQNWERIFARVQRPAFLPNAIAALVSVFVKAGTSPKGFETTEVQIDLSRLRFHLNNARMLRDYLAQVLRSVKRTHEQVYLFIDGIDDLECFNRIPFDPAAMNLLRAFIQGTLQWDQDSKPPIKLIALVRPEFLDLAKLENIREKIEDISLVLDWDEESLFQMLRHRIQIEVDALLERSKLRGGHARRISTRELFGKTEPEHHEIITRLFNYSFNRPRDVIRYTKFVAEHALRKNPDQPLPLEYFDRVLDKQRRYLLNEMKAELAITLPHYERFVQMLMHINATHDQQIFLPRDIVEGEIARVIDTLEEPLDVREVLANLFDAFAVGFRGAGNSRHFKYDSEVGSFSETNQVVLHNLFREVPRDVLLIELGAPNPPDAPKQ
jgi:hypothetical protein